MLRVAPDQLDSRRFERLVREGMAALAAGDAEPAAGSLDGALALWRGAPLSDFAYASFARHGAARLALGGLDEPSVRRLVDRGPGLGAPGALAVALHHETGGNPGSIEDALRETEPGFWLSGLYPAAA